MGDGSLGLILLVFVARLMLFVAQAAPEDVRADLVKRAGRWFRWTLYAAIVLTVVTIAIVIYWQFRG